ncbi:MAG: cation:proton antiporter [Pseudomonadota bacterium]
MDGFLLLASLFLVAGVVAVPLATRFGLGSVLGYLIAGILLSPILAALNVDVIALQHFAEFGVVMMLFLVGLELEPKVLWAMRARLLGLGGLQVGGTAAAVMAVAMVFGQPWQIGLAIGFVLALSSTAIVLQTLDEKGLMKSDGGQAGFSVLLAQDIAVIPMLAFIPLLAIPELADLGADAGAHGQAEATADPTHGGGQGDGHGNSHGGEHGGGHGDDHGMELNFVESLPPALRALVTIAAIAFVIIGGSRLTRPIFRYVAGAKLRELFTATALAGVVVIALLMTLVGLSPALGTFLAGVVLANSEYRHELESDIGPFKGLLLGLFFMTVGAGINFGLLGSQIGPILGMTLGLILLKGAILYVLGAIFKVNGGDRWLFAVSLAQAGEFGFVLLSFTVANNVLPTAIADQLLLVVALSMLFTPLLFILYDRVVAPRFVEEQSREADDIDHEAPVIIAGHGRVGGIVNRILRGAGYETVVLDHSSAQLEILRTFGFRVFFGDASRPDLLEAAGIANARLLVIAIDDHEQAVEIVRYVTEMHPDVYIVARARARHDVYELYAAGCRDIIRETFDSSVRTGRSALEALGMHPYDAQRLCQSFERQDRKNLSELAGLFDMNVPAHQNAPYVARVKEMADEQAEYMQSKSTSFWTRHDRGWVPPTVDDVKAESEDNEIEQSSAERAGD